MSFNQRKAKSSRQCGMSLFLMMYSRLLWYQISYRSHPTQLQCFSIGIQKTTKFLISYIIRMFRYIWWHQSTIRVVCLYLDTIHYEFNFIKGPFLWNQDLCYLKPWIHIIAINDINDQLPIINWSISVKKFNRNRIRH